MNQQLRHWKIASRNALMAWCLLCFGCVTPFNTRLPAVANRPPEIERREAQIHDPYPDSTFGPDTGFRPLGYQDQRSEPQRAKDRYYTAILRSQAGNQSPQTAPNPLLAPQTMAPLPQGAYGQVPPGYAVAPLQGQYPSQSYPTPYGRPPNATIYSAPPQAYQTPIPTPTF